jgi:hypothetical protein
LVEIEHMGYNARLEREKRERDASATLMALNN